MLRRGLIAVAALALVLTGCVSERSPTPTIPPSTATPSAAHVANTPFPSPIPDVPMTPCPGADRPPTGADPDGTITVNWWYGSVAPGGRWVQIRNATTSKVVAFATEELGGASEPCAVRSPDGSGGPLPGGSTLELPVMHIGTIFVVVHAHPCPEGCRQAPIGWMLLPAPPIG